MTTPPTTTTDTPKPLRPAYKGIATTYAESFRQASALLDAERGRTATLTTLVTEAHKHVTTATNAARYWRWVAVVLAAVVLALLPLAVR